MFDVKITTTATGKQSRTLYMQNQHVLDVTGFMRGLTGFVRALCSRYEQYAPPGPQLIRGHLAWTEEVAGQNPVNRQAPLALSCVSSAWVKATSMTFTITNMN
jgi:hypothetical protein